MGTRHTLGGVVDTAEDVASADDQSQLDACLGRFANFTGIDAQDIFIDAKRLVSHEGFTAEFEQNAFEGTSVGG